jgi:hypothetical protein
MADEDNYEEARTALLDGVMALAKAAKKSAESGGSTPALSFAQGAKELAEASAWTTATQQRH